MISNYGVLSGKYFELAGSPTFSADERGLTGVRRFRVAGSVLSTFVRAMKGSPYLEQPPEQFPDFPLLFCVSATGKPMEKVRGEQSRFTGPSKTPIDPTRMSSEWFEVECRFEQLISFSYSFASEALTLPTSGLGWAGDPAPIDGMSIATTVPLTELQITRKNVPQWVPKRIQEAVGKVNNDVFNPISIDLSWRRKVGLGALPNPYPTSTIKDADIARGCALFIGADATPVVDAAGRIGWDAVYKFALRPEYAPWNRFFHPIRATVGSSIAGRWESLILTSETSSTIFEPISEIPFASIFL